MNIKDRIYLFVEAKGISIKKFEELCSLSNGYVSSMRKGLGAEKLNNVLTVFPDLNRDWLLYGEGEMLKPAHTTITQTNVNGNNNYIGGNGTINNTSSAQSSTEDVGEVEVAIVPQELHREPNINVYAYTRENDVETQPIVKQFSTHDLFFRVQNSAMAPKILASDIVALQRCDINCSIPGCIYMVDHRTLGAFLRKVKDEGDTLLLSSYNKEEFEDFRVRKSDVYNLARVVGLIRTDI